MKLHNGQEVNVMDQIQVKGINYFLVDLGSSRYINGVLTKYLICPTQQFEKTDNIQDKVEVVET